MRRRVAFPGRRMPRWWLGALVAGDACDASPCQNRRPCGDCRAAACCFWNCSCGGWQCVVCPDGPANAAEVPPAPPSPVCPGPTNEATTPPSLRRQQRRMGSPLPSPSKPVPDCMVCLSPICSWGEAVHWPHCDHAGHVECVVRFMRTTNAAGVFDHERDLLPPNERTAAMQCPCRGRVFGQVFGNSIEACTARRAACRNSRGPFVEPPRRFSI